VGEAMSVAKLIQKFSTREALPVPIDDVIAEIVARGIKDEIYPFWDVNLDMTILRGYITHYEYPANANGQVRRVAQITYAKMGHEWERLVCCKELLHVLDPERYRVSSAEAIIELVEKIALPADLVDSKTDGLPVLSDRVAMTEAAAVLFPLAAKNIIAPHYSDGTISLAEIADAAEIPVRYAALVMSDGWEKLHDLLVK
jgi:hypothetical protein